MTFLKHLLRPGGRGDAIEALASDSLSRLPDAVRLDLFAVGLVQPCDVRQRQALPNTKGYKATLPRHDIGPAQAQTNRQTNAAPCTAKRRAAGEANHQEPHTHSY